MTVDWLATDETFLRAVEEYGSPTTAAKQLGGINPASARRRMRKLLARGVASSAPSSGNETTAAADPVEIIKLKREVERFRAENSDLKKQLKAAIVSANVVDDVTAIVDPVLDAWPKISHQASRKQASFGRRRKRRPVEMVLFPTDWHAHENISPEDVRGLNEYNIDVCAKRVEHTALVFDEWVENYRSLHGVSRITYAIGGDMVNNAAGLHPEQSVDTARALLQAMDAALLLAQLIRSGVKHGCDVRVVSTQGGNHGRSSKKMPHGPAAAQTSWDMAAYEQCASLLAAESIDWILSRTYSVGFDVAGQSYCLAHGDAIKGGGGNLGFPAYGANRATSAVVMSSVLEALASLSFDKIVNHFRIGHFHEETELTIPTGTFAICPSLKGTGPWELNALGKVQRPSQRIEAVHPDHGIIGVHSVDCTKPTGAGFVTGALSSSAPVFSLFT